MELSQDIVIFPLILNLLSFINLQLSETSCQIPNDQEHLTWMCDTIWEALC